jgi:diaminohydroxyphosphoribosylaminopyrimidine deaminase/5-amino-6-(5-phosphoribosylamino)uracil reductase
VDELRTFIAPIVLGGHAARSPIDGEGAPGIGEGRRALDMHTERVGDDLMVRARLREW